METNEKIHVGFDILHEIDNYPWELIKPRCALCAHSLDVPPNITPKRLTKVKNNSRVINHTYINGHEPLKQCELNYEWSIEHHEQNEFTSCRRVKVGGDEKEGHCLEGAPKCRDIYLVRGEASKNLGRVLLQRDCVKHMRGVLGRPNSCGQSHK